MAASVIGDRRSVSASRSASASASVIGNRLAPTCTRSGWCAEGNRSQGGHRLARFWTAAGSNGESRAALRVAVAWGYVSVHEIEAGDELLDRVAAMLHRLGARR